jgi:hypothetical protein
VEYLKAQEVLQKVLQTTFAKQSWMKTQQP